MISDHSTGTCGSRPKRKIEILDFKLLYLLMSYVLYSNRDRLSFHIKIFVENVTIVPQIPHFNKNISENSKIPQPTRPQSDFTSYVPSLNPLIVAKWPVCQI